MPIAYFYGMQCDRDGSPKAPASTTDCTLMHNSNTVAKSFITCILHKTRQIVDMTSAAEVRLTQPLLREVIGHNCDVTDTGLCDVADIRLGCLVSVRDSTSTHMTRCSHLAPPGPSDTARSRRMTHH